MKPYDQYVNLLGIAYNKSILARLKIHSDDWTFEKQRTNIPSDRCILHFLPSQPEGHLKEQHSHEVDCWSSGFPCCLRILAFLWSVLFLERLYLHSTAEISPTKMKKAFRNYPWKSTIQKKKIDIFYTYAHSKYFYMQYLIIFEL